MTERALRVAMRALWVISTRSRCWTSRQAATLALRAVALAGEMDVDDLGMPDPVTLSDDERPDRLYGIPNHMQLWKD